MCSFMEVFAFFGRLFVYWHEADPLYSRKTIRSENVYTRGLLKYYGSRFYSQ